MSSLHSIIEDVAVAARADAEGRDPEAHTILLHSIQRLTLAAEKPLETAKRLLYQVSHDIKYQWLGDDIDLPITATHQHFHPCRRRVGVI